MLLARVYLTDRADRYQVNSPGAIHRGAHVEIVRIDDISTSGVHLTTNISFEIGEIIAAGIPGIGVHLIRIARQSATGYGCEFLRAITTEGVSRTIEFNTNCKELKLAKEIILPTYKSPLPALFRILIISASAIIAWILIILICSSIIYYI